MQKPRELTWISRKIFVPRVTDSTATSQPPSYTLRCVPYATPIIEERASAGTERVGGLKFCARGSSVVNPPRGDKLGAWSLELELELEFGLEGRTEWGTQRHIVLGHQASRNTS